ncbi:hypothetical protein NG800_002220 [Epilithonimonas ginsengisoli]|uniref:VCBS repeat-containing protein n=1 Tax=Epilithonimonas ginsengisoli TaxID=1245592 RepID=A0ABU4JDG5_9FLAO|nr:MULTISPECIES: hypothetical protein [Chryseobacterium group]MBV6878682.1 hypothetical protein [Epilithonimonas sp. FP105]MDW8547708.1 hypothetical protein [Epilithonimonas ginsengisoli]OAH75932.1 hypothetical protein AXA65_02315 [Chryseobacterium sp. FP211-J200]
MKKKYIIVSVTFACLLSCQKAEKLAVPKPKISIEKKIISNKKQNSPAFTFKILKKDGDDRPIEIKIEITRNNKISQTITYKPNFWQVAEEPFEVSQISYFQNNTPIKEGVENFHDFIIGDYNFDGLEDFAILYDSGGNGGPSYAYYFQNNNEEFYLDQDFLLNQGSFPKKIDHINHTLTTIVPVGCCKTSTTIFQLDKNNGWNVISEKEEDMK